MPKCGTKQSVFLALIQCFLSRRRYNVETLGSILTKCICKTSCLRTNKILPKLDVNHPTSSVFSVILDAIPQVNLIINSPFWQPSRLLSRNENILYATVEEKEELKSDSLYLRLDVLQHSSFPRNSPVLVIMIINLDLHSFWIMDSGG